MNFNNLGTDLKFFHGSVKYSFPYRTKKALLYHLPLYSIFASITQQLNKYTILHWITQYMEPLQIYFNT